MNTLTELLFAQSSSKRHSESIHMNDMPYQFQLHTTSSDALNAVVHAILPAARIEPFALPATPITLHLMNADYPRGRLDADAATQLMEQPFYWAFCWASGAVLARYLLENKTIVAGKRVIDFGCGSGVVAIAAALAGASEVIACDIDPYARLATQENAALNNLELIIAEDFYDIHTSVDIILAADVLYDKENLHWLEKFRSKAKQVVVADSRIRNFNYPGYYKQGEYDACTLPDLDESAEFRRVRLYQTKLSNHV